jgi:hypothetical protein
MTALAAVPSPVPGTDDGGMKPVRDVFIWASLRRGMLNRLRRLPDEDPGR